MTIYYLTRLARGLQKRDRDGDIVTFEEWNSQLNDTTHGDN